MASASGLPFTGSLVNLESDEENEQDEPEQWFNFEQQSQPTGFAADEPIDVL